MFYLTIVLIAVLILLWIESPVIVGITLIIITVLLESLLKIIERWIGKAVGFIRHVLKLEK